MANSDARRGLVPITQGNAGGFTGKVRQYFTTAELFIGDPVVKTGTSNTAAAGLGKEWAIGTLQTVAKATAGATNATTGAVVGFGVHPDYLDRSYNPSGISRVVLVADDPHQEFEIQADSANAVAVTDIGANADYVFTHAGDTATGLSGVELDTSDMATSATAQLAILGVIPRVDNEIGTNVKLRVRINLHTEANTIVGI
tara:strand:+ start:331 stop:930 length:600 start_codon:yes stop_codon:yes gene_type:complete